MKGEAESTTANAQRRRAFLWTVPVSLGRIKKKPGFSSGVWRLAVVVVGGKGGREREEGSGDRDKGEREGDPSTGHLVRNSRVAKKMHTHARLGNLHFERIIIMVSSGRIYIRLISNLPLRVMTSIQLPLASSRLWSTLPQSQRRVHPHHCTSFTDSRAAMLL